MSRIQGVHLLALAYLAGVAGTLWDWREHYLGVSAQAPHAVIDLGGLLAIAILAFTGWRSFSRTTYAAIYIVLVLVAVVLFAPFVLMMAAPHSALMSGYMRAGMTRGILLLQGPLVVLSAYAAWHWLELARPTPARIAAALGVVVVAAASVWDLYWHQSHPLEMGAAMNMMTVPPHQLILAGFLVGLAGSAVLIFARSRPSQRATS